MALSLMAGVRSVRERIPLTRQGLQEPAQITFTDVSVEAGVGYSHGYAVARVTDPMQAVSGAAAGDYNRDGWVDLYVIRGNQAPSALLRNRGDGTFEDVAEEAGVAFADTFGSGPTFADVDGDGWLDLFLGGIEGSKPRLLMNSGDGRFVDVTGNSGIVVNGDTFSAAFGDYDRDGDLDLLTTHWMGNLDIPTEKNHLWQNDGTGFFTAVLDESIGLEVYHDPDHPAAKGRPGDFTLTGNFADIDSDGWPDLLMTGDFGTSHVFLSQGDGTFTLTTDLDVITDENGMGTAIEDYDQDGDLDWFVSSIWDPDEVGAWGHTGNRLYRNLGDGVFEDATEPASDLATGAGPVALLTSITTATSIFFTSMALFPWLEAERAPRL